MGTRSKTIMTSLCLASVAAFAAGSALAGESTESMTDSFTQERDAGPTIGFGDREGDGRGDRGGYNNHGDDRGDRNGDRRDHGNHNGNGNGYPGQGNGYPGQGGGYPGQGGGYYPPPAPRQEQIQVNNYGPQLFWYQSGLLLQGAQTVAAGIATGAWGYWGVFGGSTNFPVRTPQVTVKKMCAPNEVGVGIPPNTWALYCAALEPGLETAYTSTYGGNWNTNIQYSCPAGQALVGWDLQPSLTFTYSCAEIVSCD